MDLKDCKNRIAQEMITIQNDEQPTLFAKFVLGFMIMLVVIYVGGFIRDWLFPWFHI